MANDSDVRIDLRGGTPLFWVMEPKVPPYILFCTSGELRFIHRVAITIFV
jgi:hypothetical protein